MVTALSDDAELVADFAMESAEYLASVEQHLLSIERNSADGESIHAVFRAFHTIKSLAGFLEFEAIQEVAHETENILESVRSGESVMDPETVESVLLSADYLKECIGLLSDPFAGKPLFPSNQRILQRIRKSPAEASPDQATAPARTSAAAQPSIKVDTRKLEQLVDMIGELVVAQLMVRQSPFLNTTGNPALNHSLAQLSRVTQEIRKTAMSMRMVPIGRLFTKMERLVRDLAKKSGKQIVITTSGEQAELDRAIVDDLADPLVHMIRNSVDHGFETPVERTSLGKPACGVLNLSARHEAGCIVIRFSDDGRGLNKERILAKAVSRGLAAPRGTLTDDQIYRLIFQPGFSTAEQVTDISGRGVGMDVVCQHIEKLRGRIEIQSAEGVGCTFTFWLPLTLAIIDGLVVRVGHQRFVIPIFAIREIFRSGEETRFTIEGSREMVLYRDVLRPVVRLRQAFDIEDGALDAKLMVVIQTAHREFCLAVDHLIGKQEVVIKNLGSCFRDIPGVAGGAILGDGQVGLILDVESLVF